VATTSLATSNTENISPQKMVMCVPNESYNIIYLPTLQSVFLIEAQCIFCDVYIHCNMDSLFFRGSIQHVTSSTLLMLRFRPLLTMPKPCNVKGFDCLSALNCYQLNSHEFSGPKTESTNTKALNAAWVKYDIHWHHLYDYRIGSTALRVYHGYTTCGTRLPS